MGTVGDGHIVNYFEVTKMDDGKNQVAYSWDWGTTKAVVRDPTKVLTDVRYFATSAFSFHVMATRISHAFVPIRAPISLLDAEHREPHAMVY